ncbi:NPCBM/NEW2 domain-containing protein [Streptomyces sp. NPDC057854]|uniref:NPCBM/NEW2 domain-containing protein n=1 Tax=unclassified Streptomyces TaxID=2593676 RepID=UPI003682BDE3
MTSLKPIDDEYGAFRIKAAKLDTEEYADALVAAAYCYATRSIEFDINREWSTLGFTAGIDDGAAAESGRITVLLDGKPVFAQDLTLGKPVTRTVDVTDGLRLLVRVEKSSDQDCNKPVVVIAEPTLRQ